MDQIDQLDQLDDQGDINEECDEEPEEINMEYVLIRDSDGKEIYRDEDYK